MVHGTVLQNVHCTGTDQQYGAQRPAASSSTYGIRGNGRSGLVLRKADKQKLKARSSLMLIANIKYKAISIFIFPSMLIDEGGD
jgi:hypothetical protein